MTTTEFNNTQWKVGMRVNYKGVIHKIEALDFEENLMLLDGSINGDPYWVRCENAELVEGEPITAPAEEPVVLTDEQLEILKHTIHRAAGGLYCGGGRDMAQLVLLGFMEEAGKKSFVPDSYYRATAKGHTYLNSINNKRAVQ